ncbi:MAG: cytochrome b/b6 domain-containing protein [Gammaproteobacteria bacterium]|nr:cytochrome b/b6 domain-containing protein [Gammaproteobacteria bacterium]NNJ85036.1 cytochrome b/b6 domain-containing protein [Gammaproteobacteria bacterium]
MNQTSDNLKEYAVWDSSVRWFHWINALAIIGLIAVGTVILNGKAIGVSGEGKVLLKTVHVYIGYVFCLNILWRLIVAFVASNRFSRWGAILPMGVGFSGYIKGAKSGYLPAYLGHNPIARFMVSLLFAVLLIMAVTGIVLAGTDVYMPPLGTFFADWVTGGDTEKLAQLVPGSKEFVDKELYSEMRDFRKPFITLHYYVFFVLLAVVVLHIAAVVVAEQREKNGLISAMFTGRKVFSEKPVDLEN